MKEETTGLEGALGRFLGSKRRSDSQPSPWRAQLMERAKALGLRLQRNKGGWQVGDAWTNNLSGVEDLLADLERERRERRKP